jgi:hypothetical protein
MPPELMQCVERSRFEKDSVKGQMQATYYSVRFGGNASRDAPLSLTESLRRRYCGLLCGCNSVQYSHLGMGSDLPSDLFHQRSYSLPPSHPLALLVRAIQLLILFMHHCDPLTLFVPV